jgi:peptide/nickel transport system permease protein
VQDLLPGVLPIIITLMSVEIGIAVVVESILSFVGVSVEPDIPTWGSMIADGLVTLFDEPWGLVFPMGAIILTVLCANMLGDGLRVTLDPRLVSRREIE